MKTVYIIRVRQGPFDTHSIFAYHYIVHPDVYLLRKILSTHPHKPTQTPASAQFWAVWSLTTRNLRSHALKTNPFWCHVCHTL